ncbi:MAG TPA: hypothetical protein GXX39_00565 [Syntrophothermus lipocalidus]|nr:hypothetical protein [Syntrophothermus lipocalidus]
MLKKAVIRKAFAFALCLFFAAAVFVPPARAEQAAVNQATWRDNVVKYAGGVLYIYHHASAPTVTVSWDPSLTVKGQLLATTGDMTEGDTITARFKPLSGSGPVVFGARSGNMSFDLLVMMASAGKGKARVSIGAQTQEFQLEPADTAKVEWPTCTIYLREVKNAHRPVPAAPWRVSTTGNVLMRSTGKQDCNETEGDIRYIKKETFVLAAADGAEWLDGAAVLKGDFEFISWQFPFCPINTVNWVKSQKAPVLPPTPVPVQKESGFPVAPVAAVLLLLFFIVWRRRKKKEETSETEASPEKPKRGFRAFDVLMDILWLAAVVICIALAVWSAYQVAEARHISAPALEAAGRFIDGLIQRIKL